jgi:hypothetical protein
MNTIRVASSWSDYLLEKIIILEIIFYLVHQISADLKEWWELLVSTFDVQDIQVMAETGADKLHVPLGAMRIVIDSLEKSRWVRGPVRLQSLVSTYPLLPSLN